MTIPETYFTVSEELRLFGLSCLFGGALGVLWDIFRTVRLLLPHNWFLVALEDIAYLLFYGIFLTAFTTAAARGELRAYYIIGNLAGFVLYLLTIGNIVTSAMKKIFYAVKRVLLVITSPIRKSFVLLGKKVVVKFVGTSKVVVQRFKKIKILLRTHSILMYNRKANKMRKNVDKVGKTIKEERGEGPVQRSSGKARRARRGNRLRCDNRDHEQGLFQKTRGAG